MSRKKGLLRLETIIPRTLLFPAASARAWRLGRYRSSATALRTRLRVDGFKGPMPLRTRDTVAVETLALLATSFRVIWGTPSGLGMVLPRMQSPGYAPGRASERRFWFLAQNKPQRGDSGKPRA